MDVCEQVMFHNKIERLREMFKNSWNKTKKEKALEQNHDWYHHLSINKQYFDIFLYEKKRKNIF